MDIIPICNAWQSFEDCFGGGGFGGTLGGFWGGAFAPARGSYDPTGKHKESLQFKCERLCTRSWASIGGTGEWHCRLTCESVSEESTDEDAGASDTFRKWLREKTLGRLVQLDPKLLHCIGELLGRSDEEMAAITVYEHSPVPPGDHPAMAGPHSIFVQGAAADVTPPTYLHEYYHIFAEFSAMPGGLGGWARYVMESAVAASRGGDVYLDNAWEVSARAWVANNNFALAQCLGR